MSRTGVWAWPIIDSMPQTAPTKCERSMLSLPPVPTNTFLA